MHAALPLVAIDWGTTNRRLYLIDAAGNCLLEEEDHGGVASLGRAAIAGSIAQLRDRFPGHHMLMAGMIGSSIGWREAPYVTCPAGLEQLVKGVVPTDDPLISIIPGVRSAPEDTSDVMRGGGAADRRSCRRPCPGQWRCVPSGNAHKMGPYGERGDPSVSNRDDGGVIRPPSRALHIVRRLDGPCLCWPPI